MLNYHNGCVIRSHASFSDGSELYESGDLNRAFHIALIVPRLQPVTAEILSRLHTLSQRYVRMHLLPPGRVKRATQEHTDLYEAWIAGNTDEAIRLTHGHIETTRDDLAQLLQSPK